MSYRLQGLALDPASSESHSTRKSLERHNENRGSLAPSHLGNKVKSIRGNLGKVYYENEIDRAIMKLEFNIVIIGSPRVGKSQLINALCGKALAETSPSMNSCTVDVRKYVLEPRRKQKIDPPVR